MPEAMNPHLAQWLANAAAHGFAPGTLQCLAWQADQGEADPLGGVGASVDLAPGVSLRAQGRLTWRASHPLSNPRLVLTIEGRCPVYCRDITSVLWALDDAIVATTARDAAQAPALAAAKVEALR